MDRNLNDWIDGFIELTEDSEPPTQFLRWTAISAVASALQRKCYLRLGVSLTIYPNLYIVLVGPSATGKGTAMKYASQIMKEVPNIRMSSNSTSYQALVNKMSNMNLTDILSDGTTLYHSSLTVFSNEFTVFIGHHNYDLIAALCDLYDCDDNWVYSTISRGEEEIVGVWLNLLAGTTPENLKADLPPEAIGAGLTSRIIFVNETERRKIVVFPSATERQWELQRKLIRDLEQINLMSGQFKLTKKAATYYTDWCYENVPNPPFYDSKFDGYNGRRRTHLLTIAMVCSASRSNDLVIALQDIERANDILNQVESKMGSVFKGIGKSDIASLVSSTIQFLTNYTTEDEIPVYQIARRLEGDVDKFSLERIILTLEAAEYVKIINRPDGQVLKVLRENLI